MNNKYKKTLLIDLDGVLNEYSGKYDENVIPPPKEGADNLLKELAKDYSVKIFTSRNKTTAKEWLQDNNLSKYVQDVTNIKEPAYLQIDDRCIKFEGNYSSLLEQITNFKVWYRA